MNKFFSTTDITEEIIIDEGEIPDSIYVDILADVAYDSFRRKGPDDSANYPS